MKHHPYTTNCAACRIKISDRICRVQNGRHPENCPTSAETGLCDLVQSEYEKPDIKDFARQASIQESSGYSNREAGYDSLRPAKPRLEEIIDFCSRMGYKKLGLAFCMGLRQEAGVVEKLFVSRGFEMLSAICKIGGVPKERIGIADDEKIATGVYETMCNPILQAEFLNREQTEFNILLGLCVGHDSMFFKYAEAPCTVLAVKDRVTGHNPLAAVYTLDSYYRSLK